jgi:hypothetical protein
MKPYTKDWEDVERLIKSIILPHDHEGWGADDRKEWEPSADQIFNAIIAFAGLGVPGAVQALRAERTAIYERMRESVVKYMEAHGDEPVAILCNHRDEKLATAPYGISVVGSDDYDDIPKDFRFQGTLVKTYSVLFSSELPIVAVDGVRAATRR